MKTKLFIRNSAVLLGYCALGLGTVILLLIFLTKTSFFRGWLNHILVQQSQKQLGISLDRIEGNPLTGLVLQKVVWRSQEGGRVSLDQLKVRISVRALLRKKLSFSLLSISGLHVTVVRTPKGLFLPFPSPPGRTTKKAGLPTLDFQRIIINKASLTIKDYLRRKPTQISLPKIQAGIFLSQESIELNYLELLTAQSQFYLQGKVNLQKEHFFDLQGRSPKICLNEVQNILGQNKIPAALLGPLKAKGRIQGTLKDCTIFISCQALKQKGRWQVRGNLDLSDPAFPRYQMRIALKHFPLALWLPAKQQGGLPPYIDLSAQIKGEGIRPGEISTEFKSNISPFTLFGQPIVGIRLSGRLDGHDLQLAELKIRGSGGRLGLQGQIDLRPPFIYQLRLCFRQVDLGQLNIAGLPSSRLAGEARLQGSAGQKFPQSFQASGSIRLSPSRLGKRFLNHLLLEGSFESGLLRVSRGDIQVDGVSLSLAGTASLRRLNLVWNLKKMDLSRVTQHGAIFEGIVSGQGKISGDTKNPDLEAELIIPKLSYMDYRIANLVLKAKARGQLLQGLRFNAQASSLWRAQQRLLDSFWIKATKKDSEINWQVHGIHEGQRLFYAQGSLQIPKLRQVSIQINNLAFLLGETIWQNSEPIKIKLDSEALQILSLRIRSGQGDILMEGKIEWNGPQKMRLRLSGLPLQEVGKWIGQTVPVFGILSAQMHLSGTRASPEIDGKVEIIKGRRSTFSFDHLVQIFAYSQKNLTITTSLIQAGKETLRLTGTLSVDLSLLPAQNRWSRSGSAVQLQIQELDLSSLSSVFPWVAEVKGVISGQGWMSGSILDPQFRGKLKFLNTSFRVKPLFQVFKIKSALITANSQRISIEEVSLAGESGAGKLSGILELAGFSVKGLKAKVIMDHWKIRYSPSTYFIFDGKLSAEGILPRLSLSGRIMTSEGKMKISDFVFAKQTEIQVVQAKGEELSVVENKPAFFKQNISLDLTVNIDRNLWVIGDQTRVELKGKLSIRKPYGQEPVITGSIETMRGTYSFYGKEFAIQKGIIQFQGSTPINPLLDMKTVYQVGTTNIFILITGTRQSPLVSLQSDDQTLSQDTLISLLVFGQPPENLNQKEAASLQGEAFALLGRVVATQVLGIFGEKLPVDTVQIRASEQGISTLELGKYLTRDVFVSFGKEFGQEKGSEQVKVEYYLYSNLTLEAEIRSDQRSGVNLIWKKDF